MARILLIIAIIVVSLIESTFAQSKIEKEFFNGNYVKVEQLVEVKIEQNSVTPDELTFSAKAKQLQFDFPASIRYFQLMLQQNSTSSIAIEGIGDCYAALGENQQAIMQYNKILPSDTSNVAFWGKYVQQLFELDEYEMASAILYKLKLSNSENDYVIKKLIASEFKRKKYKQTIALADEFLKDNPDNIKVHSFRLVALQKTKMYESAIEEGNTILALDSTNLMALNKIGNIAFNNLKDYKIAVKAFRKLNILEDYEDIDMVKNQGICEYFVGNYDHAIQLLDKLSFVLTDDVFVYFYAGLSYDNVGKIDAALKRLEIAATLCIPDYAANVYHHLGRAYASNRMKDEAIETYLKVREYDPTNYQALYDIAIIYDEFSRNKTFCLPYYEQFVLECDNSRSNDLKYAQDRIRRIKEEAFFAGE